MFIRPCEQRSASVSRGGGGRYKLFVLVKDCGYGLGLALERMGKKDSGGGGKKDGGGKGGAKAKGILWAVKVHSVFS